MSTTATTPPLIDKISTSQDTGDATETLNDAILRFLICVFFSEGSNFSSTIFNNWLNNINLHDVAQRRQDLLRIFEKLMFNRGEFCLIGDDIQFFHENDQRRQNLELIVRYKKNKDFFTKSQNISDVNNFLIRLHPFFNTQRTSATSSVVHYSAYNYNNNLTKILDDSRESIICSFFQFFVFNHKSHYLDGSNLPLAIMKKRNCIRECLVEISNTKQFARQINVDLAVIANEVGIITSPSPCVLATSWSEESATVNYALLQYSQVFP